MRGRTPAPGFYGKLASQGDFVSCRLGPDFIRPWDAWLQAGMLESRARLGPDWLARYLNGPVWRFALGPGVCGRAAVAGVLLPSVDRVGRHFPLTLAVELASLDGAALLALAATGGGWFEQLAAPALRAMCGAMSVAALEAELAVLGAPAIAPAGAAAQPASLALARALCPDGLVDCSLFWTDEGGLEAPGLMLKCGMPAPGSFSALLAAPA
ncbi:type VI secretion-associated protein [Massilia sp. KIM]|uniref:type VI secretion system-associated protein TagF n=1 Tax=Massilia sp. KIM TaxID=1955422 RepID=UPI00098F32EA|nr:type VI secretion system-associated protein TagF [Massilia sp. KIM]OON63009.1 type VI secretion-associated protein [Massilia sp. KIM]